MRLLALSDLHVGYAVNREALAGLAACPDDWLILGGDLGETGDHMRFVFDTLGPRFRQLVWVPGNHELWTSREAGQLLGGAEKYEHLVALCRSYGVLTPEDGRLVPDISRPGLGLELRRADAEAHAI